MKITLDISQDLFSITRERPEEFAKSLRVAAAVKWYEIGKISQSKAAELIGCTRIELFNHLRDYKVSPIQLTPDDLNQLATQLPLLESAGANLSQTVITQALKLAGESE